MQRRITPPAVILVALLALTGCGAGTSPGASTGTATGTATPAIAPAAAPTATPTPAKSFSNADLTGLLSTLKDAHGKPLTVVPAAQIDQGIIKAKQLLKTAVFTPAACKALADSNAQIPDGSTYAAGTSISATDKTTTVVTVIALKDAQTMTKQLNTSQAAAAQCKTFTLEAGGQKITTETTPVDSATDGDVSFAALTKQRLATGQAQTALTVTGIKGNLAATAVKAGPAVTQQASAELTQLVNTILAHG
ncbi:hypothetical protein [Arthrobacter sp. ov118]|uniref:hypothetical protein n=1 Tax=Arthrobacter sp. ov118 TaxID=1761747 RepID=UPI0008ECA7FD|nr:hypothetical protein [Arthrobacter sp. ov118]SFU15409.1 hypothetical protein SAMN04487915_11520 [Arthrobacter sp. ov118]